MEHDHAYKLLFSHPQMVADLLRGFVREGWVQQLDFSTLEPVSGHYVSDDLREREDDCIWRVRWGKAWLYVYLLLEFQSSVDPFMAVRIMTYLGLLYQDLIKAKVLTPSGKLPPVLPLVLYNGAQRWSAAQNIAELIEVVPGGLEHYRPQLQYLLLDEGCFEESELAGLRNLAAALFRLENSREPQDVERVLTCLLDWLSAPEQRELRRAFTVWLRRVLLPSRLPGVDLPQVTDLLEMKAMLAERVQEWTRKWKQEGMEEGRQEGRQEGQAELLVRILEHKFGPLPPAYQQRILAAGPDDIWRWVDRVLSAEALEQVFD